jgi:hypothetical protein
MNKEQEFIFNLNPEQMAQVMLTGRMIAAVFRAEKNLPEKFQLGNKAAVNLILSKPVTLAEITGFLDCIGGYFSAACLAADTGRFSKEDMETADQLMALAHILQTQMALQGVLELVKK